MSERDYAMGELDRRLANIKREGVITEVDAAKGLAKVDLGDMTTDWLPWQTPRAGDDQVWSTPDVGEQVTVLSNGDPSQGTIIGSLFQNAHPQNGSDGKDRRMTFKDGTVVEFDREGSALAVRVNPAGSIVLQIGGTTLKLENGKATLTTPELLVESPQSTFTGAVNVLGLLTYAAGLTGSGGGGATLTGDFKLQGDYESVGGMTNNGKQVGSELRVTGVQHGNSTSGPTA